MGEQIRSIGDIYRSRNESDTVLLDRALAILQRMATERVGWRSWFSRWYFPHEPLRNDAANLLRESCWQMPMPEGTRLVSPPSPSEEGK